MKPVFVPRKLPVVLSPQEVGSLIAATKNLKHQTALSVAYGGGLRAGEVTTLNRRSVLNAALHRRDFSRLQVRSYSFCLALKAVRKLIERRLQVRYGFANQSRQRPRVILAHSEHRCAGGGCR
jgi:integrase